MQSARCLTSTPKPHLQSLPMGGRCFFAGLFFRRIVPGDASFFLLLVVAPIAPPAPATDETTGIFVRGFGRPKKEGGRTDAKGRSIAVAEDFGRRRRRDDEREEKPTTRTMPPRRSAVEGGARAPPGAPLFARLSSPNPFGENRRNPVAGGGGRFLSPRRRGPPPRDRFPTEGTFSRAATGRIARTEIETEANTRRVLRNPSFSYRGAVIRSLVCTLARSIPRNEPTLPMDRSPSVTPATLPPARRRRGRRSRSSSSSSERDSLTPRRSRFRFPPPRGGRA